MKPVIVNAATTMMRTTQFHSPDLSKTAYRVEESGPSASQDDAEDDHDRTRC